MIAADRRPDPAPSPAAYRAAMVALLLSAAAHAGVVLWVVSGAADRTNTIDAGGMAAIEVVLIEGPAQATAGDKAETADVSASTRPDPARQSEPKPQPEPDVATTPPTSPPLAEPEPEPVPVQNRPATEAMAVAPPAVDSAPVPPPKPPYEDPRETVSARPAAAAETADAPNLSPMADIARQSDTVERVSAVAQPGGVPGATAGAAAHADNPAPSYPFTARRRGQEGRVVLRVEVLADGTVGRIEIERSSGVRSLDKAAFDTVQRWRFRPARQHGQPVRATVQVPVRFALN